MLIVAQDWVRNCDIYKEIHKAVTLNSGSKW